jgi:rod shape determining protein RodA
MKRFFSGVADYIRETDKILLLLCTIATFFGAILVLSATYISAGYQKFIVQLLGWFIGICVAVLLSLVDYKTMTKHWYFPAVFAMGLVVIPFFFGYAPEGTDDKAWLALPFGQSIQPSELLKIAFIITFTAHVNHIPKKNISRFSNVLLLGIHGGVPVLLIHFQGDDGSALVIAFIFLAMLCVAGVHRGYFIAAGCGIAAVVPIMWFFVMNEEQKDRILALINPELYRDIIYQQARGETAIGSGGWFGYGLFNGPYVQSGKIPLGYNDFIFATAGEELGFVGCMAIILLLVAVCFRILLVARRSRDKSGEIICAGVFAMFAAQMVINLGMCVSMLPVIGVTLPFFSAGGTSTVCLYLGIGLVLSVYYHRNIKALVLGD